MSAPPMSRPMAPLPQSHSQISNREPHRAPTYVPSSRQFEPGPRNPLILGLRSGIPEEIDYALPRLIVGSYDQPDRFILANFIDAIPALLEWPTLWLDQLERGEALAQAKKNGQFGYVAEWRIDPDTEERAINSLLVLRNASFAGGAMNARYIAANKAFMRFVHRLFDLPLGYLLDDVLLGSPEPVQHTLVILQSIMPFVHPTLEVQHILSSTLPNLLIHTRDLTILHLTLPLLISGLLIPNLPPMPTELTPHLLLLLSLSPPPSILDLTLDLLISLTLASGPARLVLSSTSISAHIRHLMRLLDHGARQTSASFDPPRWAVGSMARNPASSAFAADEASRQRGIEREEAQKRIETYGSGSVMVDVGDRPPILADSIKAKLFKMKEPQRSIAWMHESFVYSSMSQLLQVAFWHSYRDIFSTAQVTEQLLSASEVIKNVTVAFPGAAAKVWVDETGQQKFVIAGIGFRKSHEELEKYSCRWTGCSSRHSAINPTQLLTHLTTTHLSQSPTSCAWSLCSHTPCTTSHLLTHLPFPRQRTVPDMILSNPSSSHWLSMPDVTRRPIPNLPPIYKLHFTANSTPTDQRTRSPMGVAFLAALLIRNLAKTLKGEIATVRPVVVEMDEADKKKLRDQKFGLPIPDIVLQEEEEEERAAQGQEMDMGEERLSDEERERARLAFESCEERLGEILADNLSGLGQYLGEAWGW